MTYASAGNVRASASLGAGANASHSIDLSGKIEGQITIKNTPGGSVSSTRGVQVDVLPRYGSGPTDSTIALTTYVLPSAAASTAESRTIYVGTGKFTLKITNLDTTNAVTVEITMDTVDGLA